MTNLESMQATILAAQNGDASAEQFLRSLVARVGEKAPLHSLLKISRFFADEIYRDAQRDAALEN